MTGEQLIDSYGRTLNYLRLSVTDRCNFRCHYCMPEEGMTFAHRKDLFSWEELFRLSSLFCEMGVSKIRITGGEPFVRPGIISFLEQLNALPGLEEITITSNGTLLLQHISKLKLLGIRKVNISLDSLDRERFFRLTRRNQFTLVYNTVFKLLEEGFEVKLNCVVAAGKNTADILPFIALTQQHPLSVRFLEEMPFNGSDQFDQANWTYKAIYQHIIHHFPQAEKIADGPNSTAINYRIPGYKGSFGIIPSFSRTFCGSCNRIRLSATGELRTCLYGPPALNLRNLLRDGASVAEIKDVIRAAVARRQKDGFAAEQLQQTDVKHSMSVLGG